MAAWCSWTTTVPQDNTSPVLSLHSGRCQVSGKVGTKVSHFRERIILLINLILKLSVTIFSHTIVSRDILISNLYNRVIPATRLFCSDFNGHKIYWWLLKQTSLSDVSRIVFSWRFWLSTFSVSTETHTLSIMSVNFTATLISPHSFYNSSQRLSFCMYKWSIQVFFQLTLNLKLAL